LLEVFLCGQDEIGFKGPTV